MSLQVEVVKFTSVHHGLLTRPVLVQHGVTRHQIAHLIESKQLFRIHRGIYRTATAPRTWEQRMLAACLATGGVASHRSAQRLWEENPPRIDPVDWPVELTMPAAKGVRLSGVTVYRSKDLDAASCSLRQKIPVTTPMRMLLDLGAVETAERVAEVMEDLVIRRVITVAGVRNELERRARKGRRGTRTLRTVLAGWHDGDEKADSSPEVAFIRLCRKAGLPEPVPQYEVIVSGQRRKIDCAYPDRLIAVEIDGFAVHALRETFQDDRSRQNDLVQAGWQVLRFTWHDVTQRPDHVVATVQAVLDASEERSSP